MNNQEVLLFLNKKFNYKKRIGKKYIYHSFDDNLFKLEITLENGLAKSISLSSKSDKYSRIIKVRKNSKNEICISMEDKKPENIKMNEDTLSNVFVCYKSKYQQIEILKEQTLTVTYDEQPLNIILKRILEEKNLYIDKSKKQMTVSTEKLTFFEEYSKQLLIEFINFNQQKITTEVNQQEIKTELAKNKEETTKITKDSYIVPDSLYIYDRVYYLSQATTNYLEYDTREVEKFTLEIKLDHTNKKVTQLIFKDSKPKLLTKKNENIQNSPDGYQKSSIMRIMPIDDNNIKGLYKSSKEVIGINYKYFNNAQIQGSAKLNVENSKINATLDINVKSGKLKVCSTNLAFDFIDENNSYYITCQSYSKFYNLLRMSPYILKIVEEKVWVKTK